MLKYLHYFPDVSSYNQARENGYEEPWLSVTEGIGINYNKDYEEEYFTLVLLGAGTVTLYDYGYGEDSSELYYSKNGGAWTEVVLQDYSLDISVVNGDKIRIKGNNSQNGLPYFHIESTANFNAEGNVMSLLYGDNYRNQHEITATCALMGLFKECDAIISAKNLKLPATSISFGCYGLNDSDAWSGMFMRCSNLVEGPEVLPALVAEESCYCHMFDECTSLVTGPRVIAATTMNRCSCLCMFAKCTSLVNVPAILPSMTLGDFCYDEMFYRCTSLVTAPVLPATTLVNQCYAYMFEDCTNLNYVKIMSTVAPPATFLSGVSASGTLVMNKDAQWDPTGVIPAGWTVMRV